VKHLEFCNVTPGGMKCVLGLKMLMLHLVVRSECWTRKV